MAALEDRGDGTGPTRVRFNAPRDAPYDSHRVARLLKPTYLGLHTAPVRRDCVPIENSSHSSRAACGGGENTLRFGVAFAVTNRWTPRFTTVRGRLSLRWQTNIKPRDRCERGINATCFSFS